MSIIVVIMLIMIIEILKKYSKKVRVLVMTCIITPDFKTSYKYESQAVSLYFTQHFETEKVFTYL